MTLLAPHTPDSAPAGARPGLEKARQAYGFVPNLIAVLAESPATLDAYQALGGFLAGSTFTPAEQQLLLLTVSRVNGCAYCVAAHTGGARRAALAADVIEAVRNGTTIPDTRLAALHAFAVRMVEARGWLGDAEVPAFLDAGFTRAQVLEVVLAVAMKTISNYTNHLSATPLDEQMAPLRWEGTAAA